MSAEITLQNTPRSALQQPTKVMPRGKLPPEIIARIGMYLNVSDDESLLKWRKDREECKLQIECMAREDLRARVQKIFQIVKPTDADDIANFSKMHASIDGLTLANRYATEHLIRVKLGFASDAHCENFIATHRYSDAIELSKFELNKGIDVARRIFNLLGKQGRFEEGIALAYREIPLFQRDSILSGFIIYLTAANRFNDAIELTYHLCEMTRISKLPDICEEAIRCNQFEKALDIADRLYPISWIPSNQIISNIIRELSKQRRFDEALEMMKKLKNNKEEWQTIIYENMVKDCLAQEMGKGSTPVLDLRKQKSEKAIAAVDKHYKGPHKEKLLETITKKKHRNPLLFT